MTQHDQNLIDLADWRQELPLEWLKGLSEEDRAALEALQHRDVQAGALDGQVPALRINRRWYRGQRTICSKLHAKLPGTGTQQERRVGAETR